MWDFSFVCYIKRLWMKNQLFLLCYVFNQRKKMKVLPLLPEGRKEYKDKRRKYIFEV